MRDVKFGCVVVLLYRNGWDVGYCVPPNTDAPASLSRYLIDTFRNDIYSSSAVQSRGQYEAVRLQVRRTVQVQHTLDEQISAVQEDKTD